MLFRYSDTVVIGITQTIVGDSEIDFKVLTGIDVLIAVTIDDVFDLDNQLSWISRDRCSLIDNLLHYLVLITDLVVQNVVTVGIHILNYICGDVDLVVVSDEVVLGVLFDYSLFDLLQLNLFQADLLHNLQRNEPFFFNIDGVKFGTADVVEDIDFIGDLIQYLYISKNKLVVLVQCIDRIAECKVF